MLCWKVIYYTSFPLKCMKIQIDWSPLCISFFYIQQIVTINKCQNHKVFGIGRDFSRSSNLISLLRHGQLEQVVQGCVQLGSECL